MSTVGDPERIIIVEPIEEPVPCELPEAPADPIEVPEEEPVGA